MLKKFFSLFSLLIVSLPILFVFQNFTVLPDGNSRCSDGTIATKTGWEEFPKLFFTANELGHGIACAREDLKLELLKTSQQLFNNNSQKGRREVVAQLNITNEEYFEKFHELGRGTAIEYPTSHAPETNIKNPGDARLAQRLAAAAFFASPTQSLAYRTLAKEILMHWSEHTFKISDMPLARTRGTGNSENGLILGSNMVAFAAAYDLLAAGEMFKNAIERKQIEDWFSRVMEVIALSNNAWMTNCAKGTAFSYDGMSCERARGDNHVTVGAAAVYVLAVMTNNTAMQAEALNSTTPYKWGYWDRLGYIIYNKGDKTASPDRFPYVHTGEIYDRWRGHYRERVRGLQLHRSFSYPYLSLGFLTVQALAAKRQGLDLNKAIVKHNNKSIQLEKALLFYRLFLKHFDPNEPMDHLNPRINLTTMDNYMTLLGSYCVNGIANTSATDTHCALAQLPQTKKDGIIIPPVLQPGVNDKAYTNAYYHLIYAGALALTRNTPTESIYKPVLTPQKMSFAKNAFSSHIVPFEPALLVHK